MPRAAMICFSYYPWDVRVRREAEAILEAGYEVDVISLRNDGEAAHDRFRGVSVYRVNLRRRRASKLRYVFEYSMFIVAAGAALLRLHLHKRYDVIHVHNLPDILLLSALPVKLTGARLILDMHEIMPEFFMRKYNVPARHPTIGVLRFFERVCVRLADHVIVATPFLEKTVVRRCNAGGKVTTILNLPDPRYFTSGSPPKKPLDSDGEGAGPFRIIYPGTLSHLHGIDIAIKAIHLIVSRNTAQVELHIYGTGEEEPLTALVERLALERHVFFHGAVELEKLIGIMRTMDAGIVPKRNGVFIGEAFSVKLFEFTAMNIPAIVSRTAGDAFFFDESMVAFFEPENENDLARRIVELANDRSVGQHLARNAARVLKTVNWPLMKTELEAIYNGLAPIGKAPAQSGPAEESPMRLRLRRG